MRRILAAGLCALNLAFGCLAEVGHVHGAGDPHEAARGLHLDHAHPSWGIESEPAGTGAVTAGEWEPDHDGDPVRLAHSALRSPDRSTAAPAVIPVSRAVERPAVAPFSLPTRTGTPRSPPTAARPAPRAPPA